MHDITVKVNPCHSTFPMSMVALDNAKPWDLCTIKAHATLSRICFLFTHFMGGIGTFFWVVWSHGGSIYVLKSTTTYAGKFNKPDPFVWEFWMTIPSGPLTNLA